MNAMNIENLTPHPITLWSPMGPPGPDGTIPYECPVATYPVSARGFIRAEMLYHPSLAGDDYQTLAFGEVSDVPPAAPGTLYVVSEITARALAAQHPRRLDFVVVRDIVRDGGNVPASGPHVRGDIVGCGGFARVSRPARPDSEVGIGHWYGSMAGQVGSSAAGRFSILFRSDPDGGRGRMYVASDDGPRSATEAYVGARTYTWDVDGSPVYIEDIDELLHPNRRFESAMCHIDEI